MIFRRLFDNVRRFAAFSVIALFASQVHAQVVILHLRGGDRIAGTIISQNTNEVKLTTTWAREIKIPMAQIEKWEITPAAAHAAIAAGTNGAANAPGTNKFIMVMKVAPPPPRTNLWHKYWKAELAAGVDLERGTTDHQLSYARAKLTYQQPYQSDPKEFFRDIVSYDAEYGKTDGTLSDNRMSGSSKTDLDLSRRYYLYNLGAAGYDELRLITLHYEDGPGAGYHWLTGTNLAVNFELGANYQSDAHTDGTQIDETYYRLGQDLTWKINKQMSLSQKYEYFPQADSPKEYRMRFESNLSYALLLNFSLNFTVIDFYDTRPATTVPNNDFQFRTTLGWKF